MTSDHARAGRPALSDRRKAQSVVRIVDDDESILKALTEAEKLDVTDADYEIRFEEIAKASGKTAEEIKKVYDNPSFKTYMAEEILTGKAIDFLADAAKIKEGKKTSAGDFLSM